MTTAIDIPDLRRQRGAYYTPHHVADWLARQVVEASDLRSIYKIVDPACGDGMLLDAIARQWASPLRLIGVDVDADALYTTKRRSGQAIDLFCRDGLTIDDRVSEADVVIANPPWGAVLPETAESYRTDGYSVARGQFDSFDLFIEYALRTLRVGGVFGYVLPDAVLTLPEHELIRRKLLSETALLHVVRLGEGLFEGVFRGAVLIVGRKEVAREGWRIACSRLREEGRRALQNADANLGDSLDPHYVQQSRFTRNAHVMFDISARDDDPFTPALEVHTTSEWNALITWGRGTELGKKGLVTSCSSCGRIRPTRSAIIEICQDCGSRDITSDSIVRLAGAKPTVEWQTLAVGSDVRRYDFSPSREIRPDVPGIRYNLVPGPKLVVRKTGVTIQAAFDRAGIQTTQTVLHCRAAAGVDERVLFYVLGVMNSRLVQAYYLLKYGDDEWRSHPYVTPAVLRTLPIPDPRTHQETADSIIEFTRLMCARPSLTADGRIDVAVAELYGVGHQEASSWANAVFMRADALRPVVALRAFS